MVTRWTKNSTRAGSFAFTTLSCIVVMAALGCSDDGSQESTEPVAGSSGAAGASAGSGATSSQAGDGVGGATATSGAGGQSGSDATSGASGASETGGQTGEGGNGNGSNGEGGTPDGSGGSAASAGEVGGTSGNTGSSGSTGSSGAGGQGSIFTVRIIPEQDTDPVDTPHGKLAQLIATITPRAPDTVRTWRAISAVPADRCSAADLSFITGSNPPETSQAWVTMPDTAAKLGCIYNIEVDVGGQGRDVVRLRAVNNEPKVTFDRGGGDESYWHIVSTDPPLFNMPVEEPDPGEVLHFRLSGPGAEAIGCDACEFTDTTFPFGVLISASPAPPRGTYLFNVEVRDEIGAPKTIPVTYTYADCLIARSFGPIDPAPDGTGLHPYRSLQAALDAAAVAGKDVCVDSDWPANPFEVTDLILPVSTRPVNLLGNHPRTSDTREQVNILSPLGLRFAPGYRGTVSGIELTSTSTASGSITLNVVDASPEILDCAIGIPPGPNSIALAVRSTSGREARPSFVGGDIGPDGVIEPPPILVNSTGIDVAEATGGTTVLSVRGARYDLNTPYCAGLCRSIHIGPGANALILNNARISSSSNDPTGTNVAIDIDGTAARPASATILGNKTIVTQGAGTSIAIRMKNSAGVEIAQNEYIGGYLDLARFTAAIADGFVDRTGAVQPGASTGLFIHHNDFIDPSSNSFTCTSTEGDATVGILLAGSIDAAITDNGEKAGTLRPGYGITGGSAAPYWTPSSQCVAPTNAAIWLLQTQAVHIANNQITTSLPDQNEACRPFGTKPDIIAVLDGIAANPSSSAAPLGPALGSSGLIVEKNVLACDPWGADNKLALDRCVALELNRGANGAVPALIANNYLASFRGRTLVGATLNGVSGARVVNNTVELAFLTRFYDPEPPAGSLVKHGLEITGGSGIQLANNIVVMGNDAARDNVASSVPLLIDTTSGFPVTLLQNSLFWRERDVPATSLPVIRLTGATTTDIVPAQVNQVPNVTTVGGNLVGAPGFVRPSSIALRGRTRLGPTSPALRAGLQGSSALVPDDDIDGEARPGSAVDIGWDQRVGVSAFD